MVKVRDVLVTVSAIGVLFMLVVSGAAIAVKLTWSDTLTKVGTERVLTEVVVQPGDTLWDIARTQMPEEDPRDAVARIRELNQLPSAQIFPGQVLTLETTRPMQGHQLASR